MCSAGLRLMGFWFAGDLDEESLFGATAAESDLAGFASAAPLFVTPLRAPFALSPSSREPVAPPTSEPELSLCAEPSKLLAAFALDDAGLAMLPAMPGLASAVFGGVSVLGVVTRFNEPLVASAPFAAPSTEAIVGVALPAIEPATLPAPLVVPPIDPAVDAALPPMEPATLPAMLPAPFAVPNIVPPAFAAVFCAVAAVSSTLLRAPLAALVARFVARSVVPVAERRSDPTPLVSESMEPATLPAISPSIERVP